MWKILTVLIFASGLARAGTQTESPRTTDRYLMIDEYYGPRYVEQWTDVAAFAKALSGLPRTEHLRRAPIARSGNRWLTVGRDGLELVELVDGGAKISIHRLTFDGHGLRTAGRSGRPVEFPGLTIDEIESRYRAAFQIK